MTTNTPPDIDREAERIDLFTRRLVVLWTPGAVDDRWAVSCAHGFVRTGLTQAKAREAYAVTSWCPGCRA